MRMKPNPNFNPCGTSFAVSAFLLAMTASVSGQDKAAKPSADSGPAAPIKPVASAGLLNDWLRGQSDVFKDLDLGGQFRVRYEGKDNGGNDGRYASQDFLQNLPPGKFNDNSFVYLREKVHLGYTPSPWLGFYAEARDSSSTGDERNPNPGADQFDLHQAFITLGDARTFPITLKAGRQELVYGDERLIGNGDWGNLLRSFDAAKLRFENEDVWVDAFTGRLVLPDNHNFNAVNDYDWLSGLYASTKTLIPRQETQLYVLSRNASAQAAAADSGSLVSLPGPRDIYTFGLRVKSLPGQWNGWDYGAELAKQYGSINIGGRRLDQDAFASAVLGGYTFAKTWGTPRLGLEYDYASGDSDPGDGKSGTFENLFPTNHKHYGYMDFIGWRNIHDARLSASLKPLKPLSVSLDYHLFWLADTHDSFYPESGSGRSGNGYGKHPDYNNFVGSEIDLDATYTFKPWASLRAGYGHFFVGDYVKSSLAGSGGATDADWIYVQLTFNF